MKKGLLLALCCFYLANAVFAQLGAIGGCDDCPVATKVYKTSYQGDPVQLKIFPNPATDYIELKNSSSVDQILIYNVVGKKMIHFDVKENRKYNISTLPYGMYLVQLIGKNNKIIKTQRLSKR